MLFFSSFVFTVLLGARGGNAAPLIQERGVGADLLGRFKLMAQYASAAYCSNNFNSPGDQIECGSGNCPQVQDADTKTLIEYERKDTRTDVTGFVAVDNTNELIVVSFRGSASIDAWRTNLELDMVTTDICSGCTAHRGFWNSWLDARDRVLPAVKQAATSYPSYKIIATGHSLGGAVASLASAQLRNSGYTIALYTFGSPRIGGSEISIYITNQSGGNYRITHWNDPIPNVPLVMMGYVHISPEYYINKPSRQDVQANDMQTFEGATNSKGNAAWIMTDFDAHRWYFQSVYLCTATSYGKRGLDIRGMEGMVDVVARF